MEICKTDLKRIVAYLEGAAKTYDTMRGQRYVCRAWVIRQLIKKLNRKLKDNEQENRKS